MNKGCFLLSRSIFDSAIWRDNPHVLKLFIYLLGVARYKPEPKKYHGFEVKRGEVLTSLSEISENNEYQDKTVKKWSRAKVSRMLLILEEQQYIKKLADTYGTHLTICNYERYQLLTNYQANNDETQVKRKRNASENNSNKENKGNNGKKEDIYKFPKILKEELHEEFRTYDIQIVKDYLVVRKDKNLTLTLTAWNSIKREGNKKKLKPEEVMRICIKKGWAGFDANWKYETNNNNGIIGEPT